VICVDTTVLIDEFRSRGDPNAPVNRALLAHAAETLIVPVAAAAEFLDGAAMVSPVRFQQTLKLLRLRRVVPADLELAREYGRLVSDLRQRKLLAGRSHNDLWIAATARVHGATLLTRNPADFGGIAALEVIGYG
jgi:predicted nucleic acid-binding protein